MFIFSSQQLWPTNMQESFWEFLESTIFPPAAILFFSLSSRSHNLTDYFKKWQRADQNTDHEIIFSSFLIVLKPNGLPQCTMAMPIKVHKPTYRWQHKYLRKVWLLFNSTQKELPFWFSFKHYNTGRLILYCRGAGRQTCLPNIHSRVGADGASIWAKGIHSLWVMLK